MPSGSFSNVWERVHVLVVMLSCCAFSVTQVRRLQSSVRDLKNAIRVACKLQTSARPARALLLSASTTESGASNSNDPYSRILANNDRGILHDIQRLQDVGVAVVGLNGAGRLIAETFTRYGVKRLMLVDNSRITDGDLDGIPFQAQDVGWRRDERLAAILHRLNPDVEVTSLQLSLSRQGAAIVETLRCMLASATGFGDGQWENAIGGEWNNAFSGKKPLHVVFLCSHDGGEQLAIALNDLCCEFALALVVVSVGKDGISGQSVLVAPGESSCLHCLQKRKVWKAPPPSNHNVDEFEDQEEEGEALQAAVQATEGEPEIGAVQRVQWQQEVAACLPSTDCIIAGLVVQNVLMHLLDFGTASSRLEYDGFLEELGRSELLAPVRQCPSAFCRQQQQQQQQRFLPVTAEGTKNQQAAS